MRTGWLARILATVAVLVLVTSGCGDGRGVKAVESLPRSVAAERPGDESEPPDTVEPETAEADRPSGAGPEALFEFGLFGPAAPSADTYESDCNFEDDPYETCL